MPLITHNPVLNPPLPPPLPPPIESKGRKPTPTPFSQISPSTNETTRPPAATGLISATDFSRFSYADHWKEYQIDLERVNLFI